MYNKLAKLYKLSTKKPKIALKSMHKCYPTFYAKNVYKWVMRKTIYGARCNWISVRLGHFLSVLFSGLQLVQFQRYGIAHIISSRLCISFDFENGNCNTDLLKRVFLFLRPWINTFQKYPVNEKKKTTYRS